MRIYYPIGHCLIPEQSIHKEEGEKCIHQLLGPISQKSAQCASAPLDFQAAYVELPTRSLVFHFPAGNGKSEDGSREGTAGVLDEILWVVTAWAHSYFLQNKWSMARKQVRLGRFEVAQQITMIDSILKLKGKLGSSTFLTVTLSCYNI